MKSTVMKQPVICANKFCGKSFIRETRGKNLQIFCCAECCNQAKAFKEYGTIPKKCISKEYYDMVLFGGLKKST